MRARVSPGWLVVVVVSLVAMTGWGLRALPGLGFAATPPASRPTGMADSTAEPHPHRSRDELSRDFHHGVALLQSGRHESAAAAFHRVLVHDPGLVEAHVNLGFALLGQQRAEVAHDFFMSAIELRPTQANAYYGLGEALERVGDLRGAVGAMRAFIHLATPDDPYVRKARAALWEWEAALRDTPRDDPPAAEP